MLLKEDSQKKKKKVIKRHFNFDRKVSFGVGAGGPCPLVSATSCHFDVDGRWIMLVPLYGTSTGHGR